MSPDLEDYIEVVPCPEGGKANRYEVIIMRRDSAGFVANKRSEPMKFDHAVALSKSWAAATGLKVR